MTKFSWRQWLRGTCAFIISRKRRLPKVAQTRRVEGLEERTLLTAPVAVDDSGYVVNEDETLNGSSVLDNDTDVDNDIDHAELDSGPSNAASFTFNTDGTFSYTPLANFHGVDTFTYHAVDGTPEDSNIATVTITVGQVNDAGTFGGDTSGSGAEDTDITGTLTFSDAIDGFSTPDFAVSVVALNGIASIDPATGDWAYTPSADYHGADSFTVTVHDDDGNAETQVISLTIVSVDDAGVFAGNTSGSGTEDNDTTGTLTFTDAVDGFTTPDFAITVNPTHGTASIDPDSGDWIYTPAANFHGVDSFTVTVHDDDGNAETQVISLTIISVNDAPVANGSSFTVSKNKDLTGTLTGSDLDGDVLTFAAGAVAPSHGTVVIHPNGTFTYTPEANYVGPDSFSFMVNDGTVNSTEATVTITVANNLLPTANAGSFSTNEDTPYNGTLTGADADSDPLTYHLGSLSPARGSVVINPDGTFTYTPTADYHGADSFTFYVNDGIGNSAEATIAITVVAVNDAPVANAASTAVDEDAVLNGVLTGADIDGDGLTYHAGAVIPAHGTVVVNPDGTYTYTPAADYNGSDSFSFFVNDGTLDSTEATISITVGAVNDAPAATAGSFSTNEDTPLNGSLTGSDIDGDSLTFHAGAVGPSHGTLVINLDGSFTYTPAANYNGTDTFSFFVNDGTVNSADAVVTVTIAAVNDAPVANAGTFNVSKNDALNGTLTGSDLEGDALTFHAGLTAPSHGTVVINLNGTFTYTPDADYFGSDTFSFFVNDGALDSTEATVTITVVNNELPTANGNSFSTDEDTSLNGTLTGADAESDPLTFHLGSVNPAHGTVLVNLDGTFTYTPATNYNGPDSFTFYTNDGLGNSAEATILLTIVAVNDAPVANAASVSTNEDSPLNGMLTASDIDGNSLTYSAGAIAPSHGTVTINADGTFTYTPAGNYFGTDTFSFKVNDGTANSSDATVTVTVNSVNDAPTVTNGSATVNEDAVLNGSVSALGLDIEGNALTYVVVTPPAHGTLVLSPDGTFVYTPNANYNGPDSFTFKANDGLADSNVGTFNIAVTSLDDALVLNLPGSTIQVARNNVSVPIDSAASVGDPDTTVNYANAQIRAAVIAGGTAADNKHGRVSLKIQNQGTGVGLVKVKGSKIYFNGSSTAIAKFTGGTKGHPLVITFTSAATEQAVNAVLKQISIQASKKASTGMRLIGVEVNAGGQIAQATKFANVN